MSREIRFRGWDTRQKVMYSAEEMGQDQLTLSVDGRGFINVSGRSTKLSTFCTHIIPMQYIGLKDRNGVEIWEDSIMRSADGLRNFIVRWNTKQARWYLHGIGPAWCVNEPQWDEYEVIGDIHTTPELLEGK